MDRIDKAGRVDGYAARTKNTIGLVDCLLRISFNVFKYLV